VKFTDHLEHDAARLREEFGPAEALVEVQVYGIAFVRAFCTDQLYVSLGNERDILNLIPWRDRRRRREVRQSFRMVREEIARRRRLCESVAKAWGME
jgi:hypothetical protein